GKLLPSWLELTSVNGAWKARFVGRWGNARPLPQVEIKGEDIQFLSPKEEEGSKNDLLFEGKWAGNNLKGQAKGPNGVAWTWTGQRAPALAPPKHVKWGKPVALFNGHDFAGWTFDNPAKAAGWTIENSCMINRSAGSNIATERRMQDFK